MTPMDRRQLGAVFVPEERIGQAAVSNLSLIQNSFLTSGKRMGFASAGIIDWSAVGEYTGHILDRFDVRATGRDALASSLSGGNLQKFIVGREILQAPQLIIVSQPTWGVDIGAATTIRQKLLNLSQTGKAVILISQDLEEIFQLSDKIAVLNNGNLSEVLSANDISAANVGLLMGGNSKSQNDQEESK